MNLEQIKEIQNKFYVKFGNPYGNQWLNIVKDHEGILFLLHQHKCSSLLEIGCWQGYTTRLIYESGITNIKTIDIHNKMNTTYIHPYHDIKDKEFYGSYLKDIGIIPTFCDSRTYVPKDNEKYDATFIDGNHEYDYVKPDTMLALKMTNKLLLWHDYHNGNPGVDQFIDEFKINHNIAVYPESAVVYMSI